MNGWKKFIAWLKEPPWRFLIVVYAVALSSAIGAIVLATAKDLVFALKITAYALYALAAVSLGYSVYTIVKVVPKLKGKIVALLQKRQFTNRILMQYGFRTVIFAIGAFSISVAHAILNGVIGILNLSVWYGALSIYYFLLTFMRGGVLLFHRTKRRRPDKAEKNEEKKRVGIYRRCGVGLIVLPFALSFAILQMVQGVNSFEHAGIMIYVAAAYAFYKIIMAIVNIFKARKDEDLTVRALRSINLADAFVSILALQTAMFKEFGGAELAGIMNAVTGAIVCALTAALGVFMIVESKIKEGKGVTEDERTER